MTSVCELIESAAQLVRTEPYKRVDGGHTTLAIWRSVCPTCGEAFETRTPVRARGFGSNRRRTKHKRPAGALVDGHQGASFEPQLISSGLLRTSHKIQLAFNSRALSRRPLMESIHVLHRSLMEIANV
jgi:hypothetical protein